MEVWSRKIKTYYILKVVKTLFINQIKPIRLDDKVVDYVLNGLWVIGSEIWRIEPYQSQMYYFQWVSSGEEE